MKVAIIGAGPAGICAGRHCLDQNITFDIYEQTSQLGGVWVYTDQVGLDENGVEIHTAMYKDLRVNVAKELMMLDEVPYEEQGVSYVGSEVVLDYIRKYAKQFKIEPHIKFCTKVIKVQPKNNSWLVQSQDVKTKELQEKIYDAIIVCNGHFKDTVIPIIPGLHEYPGRVIHSHDYRTSNTYKDRRVLLIGGSFSGLDLAELIAPVAKEVYLSHNAQIEKSLPDKIVKKGLVIKFHGSKAYFDDDTVSEVDDIILCTGYLYTFPFLSTDCGVKVTDNWVNPLYKQVISIENPTLAIIGLPFIALPFPIFGLQIRFFLASLTKHFILPSKQEMLKSLSEEVESKVKMGIPLRKYHQLNDYQGQYFDDLVKIAKIKPIPPVIQKLYVHIKSNIIRSLNWRLIDDENFEQVL